LGSGYQTQAQYIAGGKENELEHVARALVGIGAHQSGRTPNGGHMPSTPGARPTPQHLR